jgi:hypothetical protein
MAEETYEKVNHPSHYNRYSIEAVEMARRIWGDEALITAAEITAFFYRMRMGLKPENSVQQELDKEEFWLNYAKSLRAANGINGGKKETKELLTD